MIAGVLLAGGRSRRMGRDKSQLCLPGTSTSLLSHGLVMLSAIGVKPLLISAGSEIIRPDVATIDYQLVPDCYPDSGPLAGLQSALQHCRQVGAALEGCLIIPVDMPGLTVRMLRDLIDAGQQQGVGCYYQRSYLPLYLHLQGQLYGRILDYLTGQLSSANDLSLRSLCQTFAMPGLPVDDTDKLDNINYPDDWQRWQASIQPLKE